MFTVGFNIKTMFVDSRKIIDETRRRSIAPLTRAGGYIRNTAMNSIKQASGRRTVSMPGQPPLRHLSRTVGGKQEVYVTKTGKRKTRKVGAVGRRVALTNIKYAVDQSRLSLICGPVGFNKTYGGKTVPEILEFGADVPVKEIKDSSGWHRLWGAAPPDAEVRNTTYHYEPRPFMGPALEKAAERGVMAGLWKG